MTSPLPAPKSTAALIGALAVLLAILHLGTIAAQREGLQAALAASDAFVAAQQAKARESVIMAHANTPGLDRDVRAGALGEAMRLHGGARGIEALEARHKALREQTQAAAARASGLALGESGLGLAILLLAVGEMIASSGLRRGGLALGALGVVAGLLAVLGFGF